MTGTFPQRCHCCGFCGRVLPAHLSRQQCHLPVRFGCNKLKGKKTKPKTQIKGSFRGRSCHRDFGECCCASFHCDLNLPNMHWPAFVFCLRGASQSLPCPSAGGAQGWCEQPFLGLVPVSGWALLTWRQVPGLDDSSPPCL